MNLLLDGEATRYRAAAARANYLSADRPDIQFTAKEACRFMAKPTKSGWTALKRLARYLIGCPRLVYMYPWQTMNTAEIQVYTDTDWAGCLKTRKSTSGGCMLLGSHLLKSWS